MLVLGVYDVDITSVDIWLSYTIYATCFAISIFLLCHGPRCCHRNFVESYYVILNGLEWCAMFSCFCLLIFQPNILGHHYPYYCTCFAISRCLLCHISRNNHLNIIISATGISLSLLFKVFFQGLRWRFFLLFFQLFSWWCPK